MHEEAALFKALSDPTRLRLAVLLATHGEVCVCVLAEALAEPDFKVSRHLRVLRSAGIVEARREGTWMHYKLAEPRSRLEACLQECFRDGLKEHETVLEDARRLGQATCDQPRKIADPDCCRPVRDEISAFVETLPGRLDGSDRRTTERTAT